MRPARIVRTLLLAAILPLVSVGADAASALVGESLELAVKATYLIKFGPFVEWPAMTFETPKSPLNLCIVGDAPFAALIDQAASGQHVDMRPIVVRHLTVATPDAACHVMFVAGSMMQTVREALDTVRGKPILTITDEASAEPAHGMINFVLQDNRVRFDIDGVEAAKGKIVISSKLLSLARSVRSVP